MRTVKPKQVVIEYVAGPLRGCLWVRFECTQCGDVRWILADSHQRLTEGSRTEWETCLPRDWGHGPRCEDCRGRGGKAKPRPGDGRGTGLAFGRCQG